MTKPYHITPEQALELANEVEAAGFDITVYQDGGVEGHTVEAFQAFANAALDKVLGELVADAFIDNYGDLKIYPTGIASKAILIRSGGNKLYATRREK